MRQIKKSDLFNGGVLVIDEDFEEEIFQEVQIDLVTVITNGHDERTAFVQDADLPGQG